MKPFNITNGDCFRWRNLWPNIAAVFEMAVADPQTISLTRHMADKGAPVQYDHVPLGKLCRALADLVTAIVARKLYVLKSLGT